MTCITVHGIREDGSDSVDRIGDGLSDRGHLVQDFDYGRVGFFAGRSRRVQNKAGKSLYRRTVEIQGRPNAVCFSFGCLVSLRAMEHGAHFQTLIWFSPAMDVDFMIPNWGCKKLVIVHNPHDRAIALGGVLWGSDFGKMGMYGSKYASLDHRITNRKVEYEEAGRNGWLDHSSHFIGENLDSWIDFSDSVFSD